MTELQAAVGVAQLKKVPGFLKEFSEGKKLLDGAIADCRWLEPRHELPGSRVVPYFWTCLFRGERANIGYDVFKAALRQAGAPFGTGYLQAPAYMYEYLRKPLAYGNKGCPYNCHLYAGKVDWREGLCPVAEEIVPRIVQTNNMVPLEVAANAAKALKEAIRLAVSGAVEPLRYTELDFRILNLVRDLGGLEPAEASRVFDERGWEHFEEAGMWSAMEDLRYRYPYKLAHAGPRKFIYHDLSK
jgi:hypothetical protein